MRYIRMAALAATLGLACSTAAFAVPQCYTSYGGTKPNKLYLYFPAAADATYPEFGGASIGVPNTSPAHAFNVADLTSYTGTAADLRDAIYDVVADDYCEFNVEVIQTTTAPPTTAARRNTVAVTTDDGTSAGGLFGLAQAVDAGDATPVDFAYVWGATYQGLYGGAGGALNGANSTLERWARSIGGTAAHEAGHNYGLSHNDGLVLAAGEDVLTHHLMASGSHYSGEDRAGYRRHFSDHEYSVLAGNVGLSVQTMWNWDFVNPNAQTATKVQIDFLSTQPSLTLQWAYNGNESPWVNPAVSASLGTQTFKGVVYNHYQVTWTAGHVWDGHVPGGPGPSPGVSGEVAGGASFHVGTGFVGVDYNQPDPIIITQVTLFDGTGAALALHPRAVSFDSGALDAADGAFNVRAVNFRGAALRIDNLNVHLLPRQLSINSMVASATESLAMSTTHRVVTENPFILRDVRNAPFAAWEAPRTIKLARQLKSGQVLPIRIARLSDRRHVVERITAEDCQREDRLKGRDVVKCTPGMNVDLFPATTTYIVATVTDPRAKHWDYDKKRYVHGPVTTHGFLQIAGIHPDLNKNGVDDLIDIEMGKSKDLNKDGVPDEVQKRKLRDRDDDHR